MATGESVEPHVTMATVDKSAPVICAYLNRVAITPYLLQKQLLTDNELYHFSNKQESPAESALYLIKVLREKPDGANLFFQCLKLEMEHLGHAQIAATLRENAIQEVSCKESADTRERTKELQPKMQWSKPKETNHMPTNGSIVSSRVEKRADKVDPRDLMFTLPELKENVSGVIDKCGTAQFTLHGDKAQEECDKVQLLLMTVNDSEFYAALFNMSKTCIPESLTVATSPTFYIGNFANISSALVQHEQGSAESQHVAGEATRTFPNLKAIIAVGVCGTFGELGDVIISSKIAGFELIKYDKDCKIIPRNPSPGTSYQLYNYLSRKSNWEFHCTKKKSYLLNLLHVHHKPILSSSTVVACEEFRDKIREDVCKDALGLEMEGIGVAEEIRKIKPEIHFIIVKAGCDYADGNKSKEWQPVAAMAAADLVYFQLSKIHDDVFFTKIRATADIDASGNADDKFERDGVNCPQSNGAASQHEPVQEIYGQDRVGNELWLDIDETTHHNMIQELSEQLYEAQIHHRRLYNQLSLTEKQKERVDENSVMEDKIYDILCFYVRSKKRSVIDLLDKLRGVKKISQVHLNFIRHYQY